MKNDLQRVLDGLDVQIPEMMQQWGVAGLSVAIVKDGKVVLTKGYGFRDVQEKLPVTENTVMPIGSTTKSFTSLILSMLEEEGKLDWDKPVKEYIPWLKLSDPIVTEQVTARDLLCHRTGLPKFDVHGVFCTKDDRKEMVEDLQYLSMSAPFRTQLQYSNQMVMLGGYLAEVLTGKSWEDLVKERILEPLGMGSTCATIAELESYEDRSKGYVFTGTDNMEVPYLTLRGIGPAGAMNSNASDMAQYLLMQLGQGTKLVTEKSLEEMHKVQMNGTPYFWSMDEITEANYGLGWFVDTYRGHKMVSHGGNTLGFSSLMTLMPEEDFGLILLTNGNSNFMINALTYTILDKLLGVEVPDWTAKMQGLIGGVFGQMQAAMEARAKARTPETQPRLSLDAYCGAYQAPGFGTFTINENNGALMGDLNGYAAMFNHYHYEEFDTLIMLMGVNFPITFQYGEDGSVEGFAAMLEPTVAPVVFKKIS